MSRSLNGLLRDDFWDSDMDPEDWAGAMAPFLIEGALEAHPHNMVFGVVPKLIQLMGLSVESLVTLLFNALEMFAEEQIEEAE